VAQLASFVADVTQYHHGETSLVATITKMAQGFVGAANVPLLEPLGQFGTRAMGGADAASARYIFTRLAPVVPLLFPEADAPVLEPRVEDGEKVEPEHFAPLLPLLLINGAAGIGTGWSTAVWPHHPLAVLDACSAVLRGEPPPPLRPWARGFTGSFVPHRKGGGFESVGRVEVTAEGVEVLELPLGRWTQDYKSWLIEQQKNEGCPWRSFSERHTERSVHFVLHASAAQLDRLGREPDLTRRLGLRASHSLTNMHVFDEHGALLRLQSAGEAIARFVPVRLATYEARKAYQLESLGRELRRLEAQARFVALVAGGTLRLNTPRSEVDAQLATLGFSATDPGGGGRAEPRGRRGSDDAEAGGAAGAPFDYLLRLPLAGLTEERVARLEARCETVRSEMAELGPMSARGMYEEELAALRPRLAAILGEEAAYDSPAEGDWG